VTGSKDVISMRALVVYESMYGNTHVVASNIADGLRGTYEVTLIPVAAATADLIAGADLMVVGAPTHMHGLSTASSRQAARKAAAKPESGLTLDPEAGGPALRDWLSSLAGGHALAAAFDTRLTGAPMLTGRASRGIGRLLTRHGYRLVVPPESFLVTKLNTLVDGEASRARRWGEALAAAAGLAVPAARQ
jgi:flavodoxin-like protein